MSSGAKEPPGLSEDTAADAIGAANLQEQDNSQPLSYKDIMMKNKVDLKKKEEEVQEYANKLSKIKSRTKLSRRSTDPSTSLDSSSKLDSSLPKLGDEGNVNDIDEANTPKAKSHLLQKKLAENRKIFEQRSKEITESNRAVEEKVEEIRKQITETELQKDLHIPISINPISLLPQHPLKDTHKLQEKDNKIEELNMKIHELEAIIIDLQDNLKEKDSVIDSKMKAVTLMSEDLSKRGKTTLDTLEETKDEMRVMQQNFVLMETSFKDKHEHLLEQLEDKSNRVIELEETLDKMENEKMKKPVDQTDLSSPSADVMVEEMRREMTAMQENFILIESSLKDKVNHLIVQLEERERRLAEMEEGSSLNERTIDNADEMNRLEESNRVLKEENEKLMKTVENLKIQNEMNQEKDNRIVELERIVGELKVKSAEGEAGVEESEAVQKLKKELDDLNKNMIKLKAQHKGKLRNLNKRLENFKMVSDANAELVKLGNQVALLEEEKGNLQLSLVDFDELKASSVELQTRISELESKVEAQTGVIQAHVDAIAALENQKLDLMQELHNVKQEVSALEAENADCENLRVTAELKVVELEDQLESLNRLKSSKNSTTSSQNDQFDDTKPPTVDSFESIEENRNELLKQVDLLTQKNQNLEMQLREFRQRDPTIEKKSSDTDSTESFERISDNNDGSTKMDVLTEGTTDFTKKLTISEEKLSEAQENVTELHPKIENLVQENSDLVIELTKIQEKLTRQTENYEEKLINLETQNLELKESLTNLCNQQAFTSLAAEISNCKQMNEQQLQLIENLEMDLLRSNQELSQKREEITECQQLIKDLTIIQSKFTEMEDKIEQLNFEKSSIAQKFQLSSTEITELSLKSKKVDEIHTERINNLQTQLSEQNSTISSQKTEIISLKEIIDSNAIILEELKEENNELKLKIDSSEKEKSSIEEEIIHLSKKIELKEEAISALEGEFKTTVSVIEDRVRDKEMMLMSSESQISKLQEELEGKNKDIQEFKQKIEWLEALLQAKEMTIAEEKERMTAEFENNVKSLEEVIENKTSLVASVQTEIQSLLETLKNNELTIITLQDEINSLHSALAEKEISAVSIAEGANICQESLIEKDSLYQSCSSILASDKTEFEAVNIELQEKLRNLQSEVDNSNSIIDKLKEEIEGIVRVKSGLEEETKELRLNQLSIETSVTELSNEVQSLTSELNNKNKVIDQLKVTNDELNIRLDSMDKELKDKYNELENHKTEISNKETIIGNLREEINHLNRVITDNENNLTDIEAEWRELQQKLQEKSLSEDNNEILTQKILEKEEVINKLESVISEFNEKFDEKNIKLNELQTELINRETALSTLLEEKDNLIQQLVAETSSKEEALSSVQSLNHQIEDQTSYIEEIRAELNDAYRMMEQLKWKHMEDIEMQNHRLEEILIELNDKKSECKRLTSILEEKDNIIGANVTSEMKASLEKRIISLEEQLKNANTSSQAQLQKMKVIAANLKKKTALCQEFEAKVHDFEEKWMNEKSEKEEINNKLQQVQSDVEIKTNKIQELEQQLINSFEGTTNASQTIQRLSDELNAANDTITNLHDRVKHLQLELEKLLAEIEEKSQLIESEKLMKDSMISEKKKADEAIEMLNSELNSSNQRIEFLNGELIKRTEELKNVGESTLSNQRITEEIIERSQTQIKELEDMLNSLRNQLESSIAELERKSSEISLLSSQISSKDEKIEALTLEIDKKNQQMSSLTGEIESEKLQKESISSELEALRIKTSTELSTLEQELEETKEKARELGVRMQVMETEYVDQLNTIQTLRTENGMLSSKHAQTNERLENTEAESNERLRVIESLKNKITQLQNSHSSPHPPDACDHCERCQGIVNALEGKLQERNAEIQNLDNELANSIANFLQMRENLRTQEMQCNEESHEARKSLAQFNDLLARNSENELRIQQLHEQIINLNDKNSALDEELIKTRQVAALAQHFEELHLNLSQINKEKEKELEEVNRRFQELQIEKDDLSMKLNNLNIQERTAGKEEDMISQAAEVFQAPPAPKLFDAAKLFSAPAPWDVNSSPEDVLSLKKRLEDIEIEKNQLSSQLHQLTIEISSYQQEISQLREKNQELIQLSAETDQIKSIVRDYEQQVNLLNEENNQLRAELFQRQEFIARSVEDLRISQASTDPEIDILKREKEELQNSIRNFIIDAKRLIEGEVNPEELSTDYVADLTKIISTIRSLRQRMIDFNSTPDSQSQENKQDIVSEVVRLEQSSGLSAAPLHDDEIKLDDEEEWGWNAQEAELGSGVALASICTGETQLKAKIAELQDTIKDLEDEKLRLTEDIKVGQLRSGKLMKKLKEFKTQNENLQKQLKLQKSSGGLCDLDSAIEDELKSQISQLEKNLNEVKADHNKIIQERDNLLKRIDVLIAANERFTEMKERQDREVEVLQIRNKELANKIGIVEKDIGETFTSLETCETDKSDAEKVSKEQYDEVQESLEMLATENEELRRLLEAEKSERLAIEITLTERMREIEESKNQTDEMKIGFDETLKKCQNLETECINNLEIAHQRTIEGEKNHEMIVGQALERSQQLETELTERNERIRVLEESLNASQQHLNEAQETLSNVTELLNVRVQEVAELRQQIQQLQGAKIEAATCRVNVDNLKKKLLETEEDMSQKLSEQEEDLSRKLTLQEEDLNRKLSEREEDLTRKLTQTEEDLSRKLSQKEEENLQLSLKLQTIMQEKSQEIDSLSSRVEELSSECETLILTIETQSQEIQSLKESLDKSEWLVEALKTESDVTKETMATIENDLSSSKEEINRLTASVTALTSEMEQKVQEIFSKESEIESLKVIVTNLQTKLEEPNGQICPRCQEYEGILTEIEILKEQLRVKEVEVEDLKYLLNENTYPRIFQELQDKVNALYNEKTDLENSLSSALQQLQAQGVSAAHEALPEDKASAIVNDLQKTLDIKEAELESLKKKLDSKTTECSLLENALAKQISSSSSTGEESRAAREHTLTSSELDVALYMLHQRDVRCEELTHELMQLLEERDTLQLRLSNAIRLNEDMRRGVAGEVTALSEQPVDVDADKMQEKSDVSGEKTELAQKLSQLHTVGHRRDIRLMDDSELRNTQQMSLLAHKDALSTLPPDAAARLINANYTLSRDVQSQSSILLNWLWGKSTPKVVHM